MSLLPRGACAAKRSLCARNQETLYHAIIERSYNPFPANSAPCAAELDDPCQRRGAPPIMQGKRGIDAANTQKSI